MIKEMFEKLEPFNSPDDIPDIPIVSKDDYEGCIIPNLVRCGAIRKSDLIIGETYIGSCRNSSEALWNGEQFQYLRYKFGGYYMDYVNHFEDDDGSDVFVPIKELKYPL